MGNIEAVELSKSYLLLNHGPVTLVSSAHRDVRNVMAAAWAMPLDFDPVKVAVVIDSRSYTRELVEASGEFVLNIPSRAIADKVLSVGTASGREVDKFDAYHLKTTTASKVQAPLVEGCVAWLECKVIPEPHNEKRYDLFIAEVVAAWADKRIFNNGRWHFENAGQHTIHYVAGGSFFATGVPFDIKPESKVYRLPQFTSAAKKVWAKIPRETQGVLLSNVWCGNCAAETTIVNFAGKVTAGHLLLEGECKRCGSEVARYFED